MSKPEIIVTDPLMPSVLDGLSEVFSTNLLWQASDPAKFLDNLAPAVRAIASGHATPIDKTLMDRLPRLEIISNFGVGYDNIDATYAASRKIVVTNTPDVLTEEVADTAIGLMIMTARELSAAERWLRAGNWQQSYPLTRGSLQNRTLGIYGLGRIGQAIARRACAMNMKINYHNRNPVSGSALNYCSSLEELAKESDILMCVAPGGPATHHTVNTRILQALGRDGIFINVGRGSVVDEAALVSALQNNTIMAAGLDVFEKEPHVPDALLTMDHVVLLPHVASASVDTRNAMGQLQIDNLSQWFSGGSPITPVHETPWPPK